MSVYVLCVNSIRFILSICSIPLTLCFVFVFILFSVLPYGEIKLCITQCGMTATLTPLNSTTSKWKPASLSSHHHKKLQWWTNRKSYMDYLNWTFQTRLITSFVTLCCSQCTKSCLNYILSWRYAAVSVQRAAWTIGLSFRALVLLEIVAPSFWWFLVVIWWRCPARLPSWLMTVPSTVTLVGAYVVLYVNSSTNSSYCLQTNKLTRPRTTSSRLSPGGVNARMKKCRTKTLVGKT